MRKNHTSKLLITAITNYLFTVTIAAVLVSCGDEKPKTRATFWPDGSPKEEWTVIVTHDTLEIKEGFYQYWRDDGILSLEGYYHNGLKDGQWTKWYGTNPNIKIMEGNYSQDEMDGRWYFWMDPSHMSGMMQSDTTHAEMGSSAHEMGNSANKMNNKSGERSEFVHPEPSKFEEYKMGVPNGLSLSRHPNGQVSDSFIYVNGKIEGTYVAYHPNGQQATVAVYKNGVRVGKQIFWDENGNVVREIP